MSVDRAHAPSDTLVDSRPGRDGRPTSTIAERIAELKANSKKYENVALNCKEAQEKLRVARAKMSETIEQTLHLMHDNGGILVDFEKRYTEYQDKFSRYNAAMINKVQKQLQREEAMRKRRMGRHHNMVPSMIEGQASLPTVAEEEGMGE